MTRDGFWIIYRGACGHLLAGICLRLAVDVLPAETSLDAEMAAGNGMIRRRSHFDDALILHMKLKIASHTTIGADRASNRLIVGMPLIGLA